MALATGTRLGAYEITALIGAGGMGEVYRARDTKLHRDVALKILPDAFASDRERLARFTREAQLLASLNHPNIAAIYGVEEGPAEAGYHDSGDVASGSPGPSGVEGSRTIEALVLEFVDGPTLADRIARGPLPLDDTLPIARQIAEALEAAHEHGIVHRDLKPANIKVRADGTVKVLDFGLAKAFEPEPAAAGLSMAPTITSPAATRLGTILGTAAYMSPEQARGKTVDKRTDIWAFGCVLYEMLTGKRAFPGDEVTDVLARILEREIDLGALPADTSPAVRTVIRRCLEKDPRQRLRDIGDVRLALDGQFESPGLPIAAPRQGWTRARVAWMAAVLLAVAVVAGLLLSFLRTPAAAPEMRLEVSTPPTSDPMSFALSPDGRRMVFVATQAEQRHLWLRSLDGVTAEPLAGTEGASYPFWSPDSRSVAFFAGGKLKRFDIGSGQPQTLTDAPVGLGGTWNSDGVIVFAWGANPLSRVAASGGEATAVTTMDPSRHFSHGFPQFLPDGRRFLFVARGSPETQGIYIGSLDSREITRLTAADSAGAYIPPGWLLFVREGTLVAQRFDASRGQLTGEPVLVADPVGFDAVFLFGAFSTSPSGVIAYRASGASRRQWTWFDRAGKVLGTFGPADANGLLNPELSPDGRRVAVDRAVEGNIDVWVVDAERTTRLTFDPGVDHWPTWSPDAAQIAFDSSR